MAVPSKDSIQQSETKSYSWLFYLAEVMQARIHNARERCEVVLV